MREVMLNLVDRQRSIHQAVDVSFADAVIASLSADPETIEELHQALPRFWDFAGNAELVSTWDDGLLKEWDEGSVCLVDLPARLVVAGSDHAPPSPHGYVQFRDRGSRAKVQLWFRLSDDWVFLETIDAWNCAEKKSRKNFDARNVLYQDVISHVVHQCVAARQHRPAGSESDPPTNEVISAIHARWLMTPRHDLEGRSPRELLLEKRELIDFDLQSRRDQWCLLDKCPPPLATTSRAYCFAGFGTHEVILYYDLVRHLLWECWEQLDEVPLLDSVRLARRVERAKSIWLNTPSHETLEGRTPAEVIENERRRVPLAVSGGQAEINCDCPLCQMMAENGPVFLHLDGCHMEEDFAFSFQKTQEQWEAEQLEWRAVARDWELDPLETAPVGTKVSDTSSFVEQQPRDESCNSARAAPKFLLIAIATCLADLGLDLRESKETAPLVASLNRHFGNLRDVAREGTSTLLRPVVERLSDELNEVVDRRVDLRPKCADLQRRLSTFTRTFGG